MIILSGILFQEEMADLLLAAKPIIPLPVSTAGTDGIIYTVLLLLHWIITIITLLITETTGGTTAITAPRQHDFMQIT